MQNHIQIAGKPEVFAKVNALRKGLMTCINYTKLMVSHVEIAKGLRLRCGRIHEVIGPGADMFAVLASAKRETDIIWIGLPQAIQTLCATGLEKYVSPDRFILVETVSRSEALWSAEHALRASGGYTVVVNLPNALTLEESRRFQLAAEKGGGIGLILVQGTVKTSAAQTRWFCRPLADKNNAWEWTCIKGKNGEMGTWHVENQGGVNAASVVHLATATSA